MTETQLIIRDMANAQARPWKCLWVFHKMKDKTFGFEAPLNIRGVKITGYQAYACVRCGLHGEMGELIRKKIK